MELESKEEKELEPPKWGIKAEEVKTEQEIGEGGYGKIYKVVYNGKTLAMKSNYKFGAEYREKFIEEIKLSSRLKHPNIIRFFGTNISNDDNNGTEITKQFFLIDFADKGNLHNVIKEENPKWETKIQFALDIANGMVYLHGLKIVHRDLKSINILIQKDGSSRLVAKLADFGISKERTGNTPSTSTNGTIEYTAPEVMNSEQLHTKESDVYSFGIVLWEMINPGETPWPKHSISDVIRAVRDEHRRPEIPDETDPSYKELIQVILLFFLLLLGCFRSLKKTKTHKRFVGRK